MAFQDSMNKFNRGALGQTLGAFFQNTSRGDIQKQQMQLDEGRKGAMAKDALKALSMLESGDINSVNSLLEQRSGMIQQLGGDPSDTAELQQRLQAGDFTGVRNDLMTVVKGAQAAGYLPKADPMAAANLAKTQAETRKIEGEIAGMGKPDNKDWLKEQRQAASSSTKAIKKRAGEINTAYGKLSGLGEQMRKGGSGARAAIGAGLMSVARLISPGVVTDSDFKALSGAADPIQTAVSIIAGGKNGASVMEQMQKSIDVTNPDTFDVDSLMALAGSVIAAEAPTLFNQWQESEGQAKRAGLSSAALNTFYGGKNRELEKLRGISTPKSNIVVDY